MSANRRLHWSSPLVRMGLVSSSLLVLGLILMGQPASQAETATLSSQNVAVVPANDKLQIIVDLSHLPAKKRQGKLQVQLLNLKGKSLAKIQVASQKERAGHYVCELPAVKTDLGKLKLVCRLQGQHFAVPVRRVLLAKAHETTLTASTEFFAGSQAALRCAVHGIKSFAETMPLAGSQVAMTLRAADGKGKIISVFRGKTGQDGAVAANFRVPSVAAGQYLLEVTTRSALGEEKLQRQIQVKSDAKILLVTDKPLYQPGQTMHIRALVLQPFDLKPVGKSELVFEVEDGKGNKVFKRSEKTSDYGVATVNFELADEVNMGIYQIRALLGQQQAQKTITVKQYVLPKFKVNVTTDKSFYLPKETVKAEIQSDYFFGKPVAGSKIKVTASTFDVAFRTFQTWEGKTDASGHAKFEIKLPDYFVGQPLQKGDAIVRLEVKLTDNADHTETVNRSYPVSDQSIRISLIPESGRLVPDMVNRVYAAAIYPNGSPASCAIDLWMGREAKGKPLATVKTNAAGLAEFNIKPAAAQFRAGQWEMHTREMLGGVAPQIWGQKILLDLCAEAKDQKGNVAKTIAELNSEPTGENVLLRLNKAIYKASDTLEADIRTSAGLPTVYLDIIKNGQTLLTRWLDVKDGKAEHKLDLPLNVFGTLEVHAYQMLRSGEIVRDSRVVYVHPKNELKIKVTADKEVHQPGENGTIHFQVTDAAGKPTAAALGVIIVDEAVYALQEMQPGLEKVYFTLQEELLKPQVQMAFRPNENINNLILRPALPAPKQQIAQVLLTAVRPKLPARWEVAPGLERQQQMDNKVQQIGLALFNYASSPRPFLDSFQEFDEDSRSWDFRPQMLREIIKTGFLDPSQMNDLLGRELHLHDLTRLERTFTAGQLAEAVNTLRMHQLFWAMIRYTDANRAKWCADGKTWTFPTSVLAEAAKNQGLTDKWLTDVWGTPYKLVKLKKNRPEKPAVPQMAFYELVSAGPDRKFSTRDDVKLLDPNQTGAGQWWWLSSAARLAKVGQGNAWHDRRLREQQQQPWQFGGRRGDWARKAAMGGGFPDASRPWRPPWPT